MRTKSFLLALFLPICLLSLNPASGAKRAFVVGIDKYQNLDANKQLRRAALDARSIADTFQDLGFAVTFRQDLPQGEFFQDFDAFVKSIDENDVVVFYFSGHGIQIGGLNYMLPADVPPPHRAVEEFLKGRSVQLNAIIEQLGTRKPAIRLIIVDACRENPYQLAGRSVGAARGLATVDRVKGTFIMFSADSGQRALDSLHDEDSNSPYTRTLVSIFHEPGRTLPEIARKVRRGVEDLVATVHHEQSPAYYDGLSGDFCLSGECRSVDELNEELKKRELEGIAQSEELQRLKLEAEKKQIEQDQASIEERKLRDEAKSLEEKVKVLESTLAAERAAAPKAEAKRTEDDAKLAKERMRAEDTDRTRERSPAGEHNNDAAEKAAALEAEKRSEDDAKLAKEKMQTEEAKHNEELRLAQEQARIAKEAAEAAMKRREAAQEAAVEARRKTDRAATEAGKRKERRPSNLSEYSLNIWPRNSFDYRGQTRTSKTPFGLLSCTSQGRNTPRACSLR